MKTLEEIKYEVAKELGYKDYEHMVLLGNTYWISQATDHVAKRYAEQAIERCAAVADTCLNHVNEVIVDTEVIYNVKTELK